LISTQYSRPSFIGANTGFSTVSSSDGTARSCRKILKV
jgi:hypothetical protein